MKRIIWIITALIILVSGTYLFNYFNLVKPISLKTEQDERNKGITFGVHYKNYVQTETLIFDLKTVPSDKAIIDIFRVLLQTSSALKESDFQTINLSFNGRTKFILKGKYFKELGKGYDSQNPVYIMRTFPQHLYNINGQAAYNEWNGGVLGVLGKQMEDFKDFHDKWYLNELTR
ncbi:MAG: hypothetical protein V4721_03215 [Bacteroidota bacterium]